MLVNGYEFEQSRLCGRTTFRAKIGDWAITLGEAKPSAGEGGWYYDVYPGNSVSDTSRRLNQYYSTAEAALEAALAHKFEG